MRETLPRFCLAARRFSLDGFGFCRRKAVTVRRHAAGAVAGAFSDSPDSQICKMNFQIFYFYELIFFNSRTIVGNARAGTSVFLAQCSFASKTSFSTSETFWVRRGWEFSHSAGLHSARRTALN
jgi:hypothetical protein